MNSAFVATSLADEGTKADAVPLVDDTVEKDLTKPVLFMFSRFVIVAIASASIRLLVVKTTILTIAG